MRKHLNLQIWVLLLLILKSSKAHEEISVKYEDGNQYCSLYELIEAENDPNRENHLQSKNDQVIEVDQTLYGVGYEYELQDRIKMSRTYPALDYQPTWELSNLPSNNYQLVPLDAGPVDYSKALGTLETFSIVYNLMGSKYIVKKQFARGNFGEVWFARGRLLDGVAMADSYDEDFVLKRIFCEKGESLRESGEREVHFGKKFKNSQRIARFVEFFYSHEEMWVVFRNEGISLDKLIYEKVSSEENIIYVPSRAWHDLRTSEVGKKTRLELMKQILLCLEEIKAGYVVHRDIKPSNVLVDRVQSRIIVKVADFGSAFDYKKDLYQASPPDFRQETQRYQSPEARLAAGNFPYYKVPDYLSNPVSYSYDIWSAGVLFLEVFLGMPDMFIASPLKRRRIEKELRIRSKKENFVPSERFWDQAFFIGALQEFGIHPTYMNQTMFQKAVRDRDIYHEGLTSEETEVLSRMLDWNPEKRSSARELLSHKLFDNIVT